jgi:2-oxoisovalerate dehydrogenase E2 component (dihydrolipoyl transacylase)
MNQNKHRRFGSALPVEDEDPVPSSLSSSSSRQPTPFLLADIGEGIAEVELMQWFVQEGDHVQQFDRICEVQSDKATVEITSRYDGMITSLEHSVGDMVKVGDALMYIVATGDDHHHHHGHGHGHSSTNNNKELHSAKEDPLQIPTIASKFHFSSDDDPTATMMAENGDSSFSNSNAKVLTSPAIRKLAKEYNLELSTIVGTGPKGRVSKGDVLTVLKERGLMTSNTNTTEASSSSNMAHATAPTSSAEPLGKSKTAATPTTQPGTTPVSLDQIELPLVQDTVLPLRGYNRLMAATMTSSLQIPHMVYSDEVNLNKFLQYKNEQQQQQQQPHQQKRLAFLPLAVKSASKALERYPLLNSSFDAETNQITLWSDHNIGIAMDTPRGLIVPVLKRCQDKSIPQLAQELQRLKEAAVQGTVDAEDLKGATFTLSNIGAIGAGGTYMSPVVTPPQVAIGAIGKIQRLPRFVSKDSMEVEEAHICVISWGGDHRVVDGATLARFHTQWKEYMEDPVRLLMEMK